MARTTKTKNVVIGLILLIGPSVLILIGVTLGALGLVNLHWDGPIPGFQADSITTNIANAVTGIAFILWLPALIVGIAFIATRKTNYAKN